MRILHLLQWEIKSIIPVLEEVKKQGFDTIQISPMQGTKEYNKEFWVLYQPINFKIGNPQIGNKEDLKELCYKAHNIGINIIVDIVLRHVANDKYHWLKPNEFIDEELKRDDFYCKADNINNYNDRWQCINLATELPLLNYWNHSLQDIYIRYLNELRESNVDGFRIDMAKHFAMPCENCDFYDRVFGAFKDIIVYGEVIDTTKEIIDKYSEIMLVATNGYGTNKDKMITWIESHDDFLTFGYTKKLSEDYINGEYHELCSRYKNTLYYSRPFSSAWKAEIIKMANSLKII